MHTDTYLRFDGNCREAFEFYRACLGGEFASALRFREGPADMGVPEESLDRVMHISLPLGSSVLMGSDIVQGFGPPTKFGNNFSVSLVADSREDADRIFDALSDGGTVTMPMQDMFWGSYFGSFEDRYGVNWMIQHAAGQQG